MRLVKACARATVNARRGPAGACPVDYQAVTNLNPPGYWPMHETVAAVPFNGTQKSFLLIPHTVPATSLIPPFSEECWTTSPYIYTPKGTQVFYRARNP